MGLIPKTFFDAGMARGHLITHKKKNGATSGFEMWFWYRIPAPLAPGVPTKTRFESRLCIVRSTTSTPFTLKKFKTHLMY